MIRSELSSLAERQEKIIEMQERGFQLIQTYEREANISDYVATGFKQQPMRSVGSYGRVKYGALFERVMK